MWLAIRRGDTVKKAIMIIFLIAIVVGFGAFFVKISYNQITNDSAVTGLSHDGGIRQLDNKKKVASALDDIASGRFRDAKAAIEDIVADESEPDRIKKYFRSFLPILNAILTRDLSIEDEYDLSQSINAKLFIDEAPVIQEYFSKELERAKLARSAVIPYWLIKTFYAGNKHQKNNVSVYDAYIKQFIVGKSLFNTQSANIICLYVYAKYDAASRAKDYEVLKAEIDSYLQQYNPLRENGDMHVQHTYLVKAQEVLRKNPNGSFLKNIMSKENRLDPYPSSNL